MGNVNAVDAIEAAAVKAPDRRRPWRVAPAIVLFFVAAWIAEALSGSTPPARFFLNPIVFVYLTLYYGSAALLVREVTLRWGKGWPTLLLLGGTWGIVQEGLGTKVFFDPTRVELSPLVNYGTTGGVHWAFVVQLIIYHGVYSIVLPIMLTTVLFWPERSRRWANAPVLWVCGVLQVIMTAIAYQTISPYTPPAMLYLATLIITIALIAIARFLPGGAHAEGRAHPGADADAAQAGAGARPRRRAPAARWFFAVGLVASACFFFVSLVTPGLISAPLLVIFMMLAIAALTLAWIRANTDRGRAWGPKQRLALTAGLLAPLILFSPIQETRGLTGLSLVALATTALLVWMARRPSSAVDYG